MTIVLAFLAAFGLSYVLTRLLLRRTPSGGFVDIPNPRSSHDTPKPRFGGIAIVAAFTLTFAAVCVGVPGLRGFIPVCAGGLVVFAAGLMDDYRGLGVGARFVAQCAAAAVAVATGTVLDHVTLPVAGTVHLGSFAYPLTLVVFVAGINFYNFIDGIDGLAAGGAVIAGAFLAAAALVVGQPAIAILGALLSASALGFLQFNFPPSRLFMGDGGSTFLGYWFTALAVAGTRMDPAVPVFVPLLLLSSLYVDAGLTIVRRLSRGEPVFQAHRTHYYQRLLQLGFNHKQVTLVEYLIMVLLGASAMVYLRAGTLFAPFAAAVWLALFTLGILKIRALERGDRMFWERRTLFLIAADIVAIVAAYLGAYFLRMNFQFTEAEGRAVLRALPIVVVVRSACFFKYGLYRSMWRYTGVADVIRVIKAVTAGSAVILAAVVLLYRFIAFPRTLFLIEFFLLITFVLAARFSARLFHEIGREAEGGAARRYGVIGAGDAGERALREIRAQGPTRTAACFIDDDPRRIGLTVHGVPVEGPGGRLDEIVARHRLHALVYALPGEDEAAAAAWVQRARAAGVELERVPGGEQTGGEPHAIVLDRALRGLGRAPVIPSRHARSALAGRRVLVTHGGERIGESLMTQLQVLGALAVFHFDAVPARAAGAPGVGTVSGSLIADARGLLAVANPEVVLHVVTVEPRGGLNDDAFAWEHVVRECSSVADAVRERPGCRLVVAAVWGGTRAGDDAAATAAVMEITVLNRARADSVAVVRLPRVLAANELLDARHAASRVGYDLLENEAAHLVVQIAAGAFRGIYTPAPQGEFTPGAAREAALRSDAAATPARGGPVAASRILFPVEHLDECGIDGARRVLSPLFPVSEELRERILGARFDAAGAHEAWKRVAAELLHPRALSDAGRDRRPA
jgi:UDP-GlcNAc:undecaprenyl-phosphate GlcNAc-1-phosphate transferase